MGISDEGGLIEQISDLNWKKGLKKESIESEPTSVLDNRSSPSPPNSATSTCNGGASVSGGPGLCMQDLESLSSFGGESSHLPWLMSEVDDPSFHFKHLLLPDNTMDFVGGANVGVGSTTFYAPSGLEDYNLSGSCSFRSIVNCNARDGDVEFSFGEEKPQVVGLRFGYGEPEDVMGRDSCYVPSLGYSEVENGTQPSVKRDSDTRVGWGLGEDGLSLIRNQEEQFQMQHQQQLLMPVVPQQPQNQKSMDTSRNLQVSALHDQLIKVMEMFQTGNFLLAQVILARLNQYVSFPGKPLVRAAALCVKEELEKLLSINDMSAGLIPPKSLSQYDVIHKMDAYKLFSEVSPVMQFVDFTCTQALLEALDDADTIHLIDFDIGCGSMWASFIRELQLRKRGAPFLKFTVLASTSSQHPLELALICDNILEFATECGVSVDIKVLNLDLFDPATCAFPSFQLMENEAVAVNFPISACSHCPFSLPPLLSFMKQCSPRIVIGFDSGGDRCDLAFPAHIIQALDSCSHLLESLKGSSVSTEIINKVEKFLIRPGMERTIQGRIHATDKMNGNKMHQWKSLFTSAGFVPVAFSSFTEYQAHQVVTKTPLKGFHVGKRQESLVLHWRSYELVAALTWSC